ncbi:hypothetical protein Tcan_15101 [Toxocara canis]|uniref:Uncharacterized protein n=1 Tax=Toxocara canis TaxID=6265 RepID=A0A0B2W164_TOXCA|nr:hypothetical protein Tcan_15101 [Toxocara canis]
MMIMRGLLVQLVFIVQLTYLTRAQIGEIASLVSGLVAPQLLSSAGTGAAGALGNIGTLYQIAQSALQLTGTGVGIMNQASESKWFTMAAENALNSQRDIQDKLLTAGARPDQLSLLGTNSNGLGSLGVGGFIPAGLETEFNRLGTQFPAPGPDDYDENEELPSTKQQSLVAISHTDPPPVVRTEPPTTTESPVTLFPEEKLKKVNEEIDDLLNKSSSTVRIGPLRRTEDEYYDDVKKELNEDEYSQEVTDKDRSVVVAGLPVEVDGNNATRQHEKRVPNLARLVELLRESNLSDNDVEELMHQLKENRHPGKPVTAIHRNRHFIAGNGRTPSFIKFNMSRGQSPVTIDNGKTQRPQLNNSKDDLDLLKRTHHEGNKHESKVTINTEAMNKEFSAPRAIPPTIDSKTTHEQQPRKGIERVQVVTLRRAFAVPSEERRLLETTKITKRVYPRRTVAPRPSTAAPLVKNTVATLAYSMQSAYQPSHNNNAAHTTQQQQPAHSGHFDTSRIRSARFPGSNGNSASQQRWSIDGANVGAPPHVFSTGAATSFRTPSMHNQIFHEAHGQFMPTYAPIFAPNSLTQSFGVFQPPQPMNLPYALNPNAIQHSQPQLSQYYSYHTG